MESENKPGDWLVLLQAKGLGPVACHQLLFAFQIPSNILDASAESLRQFGLSRETIESLKQPEEKILEFGLEWLAKPDHHLLTCLDGDYPPY